MLPKMLDFDYELSNEQIEGDKATVDVKITTYRIGDAFTAFFSDYISQAFMLAFSDASEEDLDDLATTILSGKLADLSEKTYEKTVRLLEKSRNRDFLTNMPYVSVGHGLAVIADINMGEDRGGEWRIAVNNNVLDSLDVDIETLFSDAMKSSVELDPPTLVDMTSALFSPEKTNLLDRDEPIAPEDIGSMYVLTNTSGSLGAAALFYPDVKEKAAELIGRDWSQSHPRD